MYWKSQSWEDWRLFMDIECVGEAKTMYWKSQSWKDWRRSSPFEGLTSRETIHASILRAIDHGNFTMFQWLLELNPAYDDRWVTKSIEKKRTQMIDHLLFKRRFKPTTDHISGVTDINFLRYLIGKRFPLSSMMVQQAILDGNEAMVGLLLDNNVKAASPVLFMELAIKNNQPAMIVKLCQRGYQCSTALMELALLRGHVGTVSTLYHLFYGTIQCVFDDESKHNAFLDKFLAIYLNEQRRDSVTFQLTNILYWMNKHRWYDLSNSLLQSRAIVRQFDDELLAVLDHRFGTPTVNHMDLAIVQSGEFAWRRLLELGVPCSYFGFMNLVQLANNKPLLWSRVEQLMQHPVCRDAVRLQTMLPMIETKAVHDRFARRDEFANLDDNDVEMDNASNGIDVVA
jgi:hypothetical protein